MIKTEFLIIGAGPAGLGAAIEASQRDVEVLIVDENNLPGGQLFKQIHKFFGSQKHRSGNRGVDIGQQLLDEAKNNGTKIMMETEVLGIMEDNKVVVLNDNAQKYIKADRIVLATGAREKGISFPGWTLPGVMTAGAAQTLTNINRVLPGERILMIGSGNVGLIVSYQLLQAGAEIAAVIEGKPTVTGYAVHAGKIRRAGVPIYTNSTIKEVKGDSSIEKAITIDVDDEFNHIEGTERKFKVDTVCLAVGLEPRMKLPQLLGCKMKFIGELGGFIPLHDKNMRSTKEKIYVAGDITGIEEANTALDEGRLAGVSVAESLGYITQLQSSKIKNRIRKRLEDLRKGPFGIIRRKSKKWLMREAESIND